LTASVRVPPCRVPPNDSRRPLADAAVRASTQGYILRLRVSPSEAVPLTSRSRSQGARSGGGLVMSAVGGAKRRPVGLTLRRRLLRRRCFLTVNSELERRLRWPCDQRPAGEGLPGLPADPRPVAFANRTMIGAFSARPVVLGTLQPFTGYGLTAPKAPAIQRQAVARRTAAGSLVTSASSSLAPTISSTSRPRMSGLWITRLRCRLKRVKSDVPIRSRLKEGQS
jgi:hypothetical protein